MIRINLLDSVTQRHRGAASKVEKKVSSPISRMALMIIVVSTLFLAVVGWDFISASRAKSDAEKQLTEQQAKSKELEKILTEQKGLEDKIKNVDLRIEAIKKLRNSQAGPSAVLSSIAARISNASDIYIDSIEQKGDQLTIQGSSPSENAVTQFGRSLEFSSGLFSNLSIETMREEVGGPSTSDGSGPVAEVIRFTIRCSYTPENAGDSESQSTTAENNGQAVPPQGIQVPNRPANAPQPPAVAVPGAEVN